MTARVRPLGAKVFLEGIEVPLIGATMTSTVGMASLAYIDIVPHSKINSIKPRTHVMLAVRDYRDLTGQSNNDPFPYVKAWEGEVFGFSFNKTANSRSMTLSCIDFTSYWDSVLTYYFNSATDLGKGDMISAVGMDFETSIKNGVKFQDIAHGLNSFFIKTMSDAVEAKSDLLIALTKVIEEVSGINNFYTNAANRLKVNNRMAAKSSQNISALFAEQEALNWYQGILGQNSGFATLRDTVNNFMSIIFHDQTTVMFPSGSSPEEQEMEADPKKRLKTNEARETFRKSIITNKKKYVNGYKVTKQKEYIFKPNLFMIPPPMCNVYFPDEYSSFSYNRNFFVEPTRLIYKPVMPTYGNSSKVPLPHAFAPFNFSNFMSGTKLTDYKVGPNEFDVGSSAQIGFWGKDHSAGDTDKITPKKREQHFLTNEEQFKGILFAQEGMVPASSEFRDSLKDVHQGPFADKVANYMLIKKRFQTRDLQITSHLKLSVVPGFTALILDDSPARQNMVAYVNSVTHRIYAKEGGFTNVTLSYARTAEEQQNSSNNKADPLIPPWFEKTIFGEMGKIDASPEAKTEIKDTVAGTTLLTPTNKALSAFFAEILGPKGSTAITDKYEKDNNIVAAVSRLLYEYKKAKANNNDILTWIAKETDRDYIRIRHAFTMLNAKTTSADTRTDNFMQFGGVGSAFDEGSPSQGFQIKTKKSTITAYRDALKTGRAFRG